MLCRFTGNVAKQDCKQFNELAAVFPVFGGTSFTANDVLSKMRYGTLSGHTNPLRKT